MNILVISPYYPPHIGGLESHALEFNAHIARVGHSVTVWTSKIPRTALTEEIFGSNIRIYRYDAIEIIPGFPVPAFWKKSFWNQWNKIRYGTKYSHIISRTRFFISSGMAHLIALSLKIPHTHVEHGSYFVRQKSNIINTIAYIYDITIGRFILQSADIVVANSKATSAFVSRLTHNTVKPHVIYRGIEHEDINTINPAYEVRNQYPQKTIVAYAGRLIGGKGVHDLLVAISQCATKESISCWIIGDGPARATLKRESEVLGLQNVVHFFGFCDHTQTISLVKVSDIVVNPSYTEGLPTSVSEAALCGKAIIATNVGGTPEIVTNRVSAILFQPKDISALANAVDEFVQNQGMRISFGKAAQVEVASKFVWEHAIQQYEKILLHTTN